MASKINGSGLDRLCTLTFLADGAMPVEMDAPMARPAPATGPAPFEAHADLRAAATLARDCMIQFLANPKNKEAVAHVVFDGFRGSRTAADQDAVDTFLRAIADGGLEVVLRLAPNAVLERARSGDVLPPGVEAALVDRVGAPPVVLVSCALGFRDLLLVAQRAVVDIVVASAAADGLAPRYPQARRDLLALLQLEDGVAPPGGSPTTAGRSTPATVAVLLEGELLDAASV